MNVVITHPEWGIYLGNALGLGFWSMMDSCEQPVAVTFPSEDAAIKHIRSWDNGNDPEAYGFVEAAANDEGYATVASLKEAGLEDMLGDMEDNVLRQMPVAGYA